MPNEQGSSPKYVYAAATVIWAVFAGLAGRLILVLVAERIGGKSALSWLGETALGLTALAAFMQAVLFLVVAFRAVLEPSLYASITCDARTRQSRWLLSLVLILGLGPLANLFGLLIGKAFGSSLESMQAIGAIIRRANSYELVLLGSVLSLLPALVEESLFRGLIFRALRGASPAFAIVLQALAFGAFHLDIAQGAATMILGLGFGFIAHCTGSLVGSMVAHAGYNLAVLLSQRFLAQATLPFWAEILQFTVGLAIAAIAAKKLYVERVQ